MPKLDQITATAVMAVAAAADEHYDSIRHVYYLTTCGWDGMDGENIPD